MADKNTRSLIKKLQKTLTGNFRLAAKSPTSLNQSMSNIYFRNGNDFIKVTNNLYNQNIFTPIERFTRYSDFDSMSELPEIQSALDAYANNTTLSNEYDEKLEITSNNDKVLEELKDLFFNVLNVPAFQWSIARNMCKNGDYFLWLDVEEGKGVMSSTPIPVQMIVREEGYDGNPRSIRFLFSPLQGVTQYSSHGLNIREQYFDNWQIAHFRLSGDEKFLPYGRSVLESARRLFRQLLMIEDAMLVYRIARASEKRVFYIDVGGIPHKDVSAFMQQIKQNLKSTNIIDPNTNNIDYRYVPMSITDDFFVPKRGANDGSSIDTLQAGENTSQIEDVKYFQKKLMMSLGVPRSYLGDESEISGKTNLAAEDYQFARSIERIQQAMIDQYEKIAVIHLMSKGYSEEDCEDFEIKMASPSFLMDAQKIEALQGRVNLAGDMVEKGFMSQEMVCKEILKYSEDKWKDIQKGRIKDAKFNTYIEVLKEPQTDDEGDSGEIEQDSDFGFSSPKGDSSKDSDEPKYSKSNGKEYNPLNPLDLGPINQMSTPKENALVEKRKRTSKYSEVQRIKKDLNKMLTEMTKD